MQRVGAVLSNVTCPALQAIPQTARFSGGKKLLGIQCVFLFSLQLLPEAFLIHRRNELDGMKNLYWSPSKLSVILISFY
jgi:hypothetical protein